MRGVIFVMRHGSSGGRFLVHAGKIKKIAESLKVSEETVQGWSEDTLRLSHTNLIRLAKLLAKYAETQK